MVAWKRRTFEAGHGSMQSVESQRENRPSALWYCWNDAGEMVARRRELNEVRAVSRSGNVALRKEERAVERSEAGGGKEASEDGRAELGLLGRMISLSGGGGGRAEAVRAARQAAPGSTGGRAVFLGTIFPEPMVIAAAVAGAVWRHGGIEDGAAFGAVPKDAIVVEASRGKAARSGGRRDCAGE